MNQAKKMVLISPEVFQKLHNPVQDESLNSLENDMTKVLHDSELEDRTKWAQYQQMLQRRQYFHDQRRQPAVIPIVEAPDETAKIQSFRNEIIKTLPKPYKSKGEMLYKRICNSDYVKWDQFGVVSINDEVLPGSSITDLVCDVVRFKHSSAPTGWREFLNALRTINIPQEFIGNPERRLSTSETPSPRPTFPSLARRRVLTPPKQRTPYATRKRPWKTVKL